MKTDAFLSLSEVSDISGLYTALAHSGIRSLTAMDVQIGMLRSNNAHWRHMGMSNDVNRRSYGDGHRHLSHP